MNEIPARGPDDPDGSGSAAVLSAHFAAEHFQVFCGLLWRRLAMMAVGWWPFGWLMSLSRAALVGGFTILAGAAFAALIGQRNASKKLRALNARYFIGFPSAS